MPAYKDKKRGTWYVKFRYVDWRGDKKETTKRGFATKREAVQYEQDFLREKANAPTMTFAALYKLYIEDLQAHDRSSTCGLIDGMAETRFLPTFGDIPVNEITPAMVRRFHATMPRLDRRDKPLTKSYKRLVLSRLSSIFRYACTYCGLPSNPVDYAGRVEGKKVNQKRVVWSFEEFSQFLQYVKRPLDRLAFLIIFETGLRAGELLALEVEDVDLDRGTMNIYKTLSNGEINETKTPASIRTIPIPQNLVDAIRDYLAHMSYRPSPLIDVNYPTLAQRFHRLVEKSGLPRISLHGLRHSHASILVSHGIPLPAIAARLGHSSPSVTLSFYSHELPSDEGRIVELLESRE